ncbi:MULTISPECIES: hypothetical protein [Actinosynnema]|uniref:hypothetical protein n=1 Tax=Actinosynnema TaxID=40566 RepID=UPI0020A34A05|nr:hypothetical protein [Actinosynnema pretiosum]MCP2097426.1 hypothetical protein [Actinosynnema pretiosum]
MRGLRGATDRRGWRHCYLVLLEQAADALVPDRLDLRWGLTALVLLLAESAHATSCREVLLRTGAAAADAALLCSAPRLHELVDTIDLAWRTAGCARRAAQADQKSTSARLSEAVRQCSVALRRSVTGCRAALRVHTSSEEMRSSAGSMV